MTGVLRGPGKYAIRFEEEAYDGLFSVIALNHTAAFEQALEILRNHVTVSPTKPIPGKLKQLTAGYKGIYQISLGGAYRIWYTVDEDKSLVYVEYCGDHPQWKGHRARRG